jgi:hypothetical protein
MIQLLVVEMNYQIRLMIVAYAYTESLICARLLGTAYNYPQPTTVSYTRLLYIVYVHKRSILQCFG